MNKERINCSRCKELNKAMDIMETLKWTAENNNYSALAFDRDTKTILVDEESLMRAIQLANPYQKYRKLKLITREEHKLYKRGHDIQDIPLEVK